MTSTSSYTFVEQESTTDINIDNEKSHKNDNNINNSSNGVNNDINENKKQQTETVDKEITENSEKETLLSLLKQYNSLCNQQLTLRERYSKLLREENKYFSYLFIRYKCLDNTATKITNNKKMASTSQSPEKKGLVTGDKEKRVKLNNIQGRSIMEVSNNTRTLVKESAGKKGLLVLEQKDERSCIRGLEDD
ncbi:hypothetical protein CDIK_0944 [Cucumispora dikerogammari]|nr:hypothetical protein CDIK_0944 [Cucumispora dikerogammari]